MLLAYELPGDVAGAGRSALAHGLSMDVEGLSKQKSGGYGGYCCEVWYPMTVCTQSRFQKCLGQAQVAPLSKRSVI